LALVSCTAIQNRIAVRGILAAKIKPVTMLPSSGLPEDSSKTEPTAAIALMQHKSKHIPLLGVIEIIFVNSCIYQLNLLFKYYRAT
jgi:hypothetical protein